MAPELAGCRHGKTIIAPPARPAPLSRSPSPHRSARQGPSPLFAGVDRAPGHPTVLTRNSSSLHTDFTERRHPRPMKIPGMKSGPALFLQVVIVLVGIVMLG